MEWLKQIAPTVATALGGPLAGVAVEALSKALGVEPDQAKQLVEEGKMTSEQLAQVKLAEIELQKQQEALGLNFEQLAVDDRKSAREMQATTKSHIPAFLAISVTAGFFGILLALMSGVAHKSEELLIMLGSLSAAWGGIIAFYFGSSAGSQRKDEMLNKGAGK
jgi:hypothetical protein